MERINGLGRNNPSKEFYFIYHEDGRCSLVSAISKKGGYVYFLVETKEKMDNNVFRPRISPISNILDYCGDPDVQVVAIDPKEPQNKDFCKIISDSIDALSMQSTQSTLE